MVSFFFCGRCKEHKFSECLKSRWAFGELSGCEIRGAFVGASGMALLMLSLMFNSPWLWYCILMFALFLNARKATK